ncbi:MAG: hypothetical protein U7127_09485 [Phormidium sp.]
MAKLTKMELAKLAPISDAHTGKKTLATRIHSCPECGYTINRDVAASQVIRNRGINAVGQTD